MHLCTHMHEYTHTHTYAHGLPAHHRQVGTSPLGAHAKAGQMRRPGCKHCRNLFKIFGFVKIPNRRCQALFPLVFEPSGILKEMKSVCF